MVVIESWMGTGTVPGLGTAASLWGDCWARVVGNLLEGGRTHEGLPETGWIRPVR
jgi:hypothetical protein